MSGLLEGHIAVITRPAMLKVGVEVIEVDRWGSFDCTSPGQLPRRSAADMGIQHAVCAG